MKKVIQINSVFGFGSTGRIVYDLKKAMEAIGYKSFVVYGRKKIVAVDNVIKISTPWDIFLHVLLSRLADKHGFGSKIRTKQTMTTMKKILPDLIHLHNIHGYYVNIKHLFEFIKNDNVPVVWTLHDCWPFTGHCAYFDYINCSKWEKECVNCPQKHKYPSSWIFDGSKNNFNNKKEIFNEHHNLTIVTPSKWMAEQVKKSFLSNYKVLTINNGIDLSVFRPSTDERRKNLKSQLGISSQFIVLGVASIWEERKGLHYFHLLANELSDDFIIIVVGVSEKQKKVLPKNIIGISRTHNLEELTEIYSAADVFVNATLEDNFPTTNLEALACGTPVITFKTGGSPEAIDETCGIVVEKGSVDGLINAIEQIRNNPFSPEACRKRAMMFDKNDKYAEYIKLYEEILAKQA